jgi:hypothetical protein
MPATAQPQVLVPILRITMAAQHDRSASDALMPTRGALTGIRVIELADEQAEYCGLTLAGLGAEVIKIEPPGGNPTRRIALLR